MTNDNKRITQYVLRFIFFISRFTHHAIFPITLLGVLLPLSLLTSSLHHDEALYAYWARLIASGIDPMLNTVPVDKPPLFIYTLALFFKTMGTLDIVARMPSLLATATSIWLVYRLGCTLYDASTGLIAALLLAMSPFAMLFAPTILTDPLMVTLALASLLAAAQEKSVWAGVWLSLAVATKQQGIFFLPLTLAFLVFYPLPSPAVTPSPLKGEGWGGGKTLIPFLLTFAIGLALPLVWDANRAYRPGFWLQSSLSYGPVGLTVGHFGNRLLGFLHLLGYATATPALNIIFAVGLAALFILSPWRQNARADWLLAGFSAAFVGLHAVFSFQIWDRYLLGLMPLLALLAARVIFIPLELKINSTRIAQIRRIFADFSEKYLRQSVQSASSTFYLLAISALVVALMFPATTRATRGEYPIGGDHGAYYGAAEISAYLRGHAGADVTLYQHWLGAHWRYYLFGFPYDLRYWQSADELARFAAANADGVQYIAFPAWQSTTPAALSLAEVGLQLKPVFKTYRPDGSPGVFLYRIRAVAKSLDKK